MPMVALLVVLHLENSFETGLAAIITAGAQEIKYEKAAGELPVKGKMKKQQADACNLCDQ